MLRDNCLKLVSEEANSIHEQIVPHKREIQWDKAIYAKTIHIYGGSKIRCRYDLIALLLCVCCLPRT